MARRIYAGIDIGTYHVKVAIAVEPETPEAPLHILGTGTSVSRGLRHGYIIDAAEATKSIREAVNNAQTGARVKIVSARVALGGVGLDEVRSAAEISLTPSGGIVSEAQIERCIREAEKRAAPKLVNRTVMHSIPLQYRVDGERVYGSPAGLQGTKLAADTLLITMLGKHHDDIVAAVEDAGIEVEGVMAAPIAASLITLTKAQKTAGVALANIGAETLSVIVFDDDTPVSVKVFPVGSSDITNTLALSFQLPLSEAEQLKRGAVTGSDVPQKKMQQIIQSRVKDMFALVNAHLKAIGRHQLLPAGIVITGGGSGLVSVAEVARMTLKIPSQLSSSIAVKTTSGADATWAVAYGLCKWGFMEDSVHVTSSVSDVVRGAWGSMKKGLSSLMP